jgi:NAD(P)-dependent dehydrogenase (short-subunit alcohol dehydrogenase family)
LVTELLARGETVAATARDPDALVDLRSPAGQAPWTARLDVTDPDRIRHVVDAAVVALGRIDIVVSNAGYGLFGAAEEATDEQVERLVRTNLTGPMHVARAVLGHMRRQGYGRILQISSVSGQSTQPGTAVYNATKWGVEGFFESLAAEVTRFGIGVTIVEPGTVRTEFTGRGREQTAALPEYAGTPAIWPGWSTPSSPPPPPRNPRCAWPSAATPTNSSTGRCRPASRRSRTRRIWRSPPI